VHYRRRRNAGVRTETSLRGSSAQICPTGTHRVARLSRDPVDADPARAISQIIAANLKRTEQFALIDQALFIQKITNFDVQPRFPDWRAINVDALVTGRVTRQPDGRLQVAFRLWDVSANAQLTGQQYFSTPDNLRRIANIISDAIYERLTGEKGNFDASTSP